MLPGKKYKPEDFLWMVWTRKWFLIIPALLIGAGTFAWSYTLPDRYSSSTTILIVPQRVPEAYVRSTVTATVTERLQAISQQILSRTRLERIVEEFNLYADERKTMIMEDVIELMRTRDIKVANAQTRRQDTGYFTVGFEASQARTAMVVAERLASMFVQENLQDREVLADSTNQFLQAQLEDARRRLLEHEAKLEAFRQRNAGQLPTQVQSNLQMMQMTQTQIQANVDAANRERDRLTTLDAAIATTVASSDQPLSGAPAAPVSTDTAPDTLPQGSIAQQLTAAKASLRNLERRLKPTHPDFVRLQRIIADLEVKAAEEAQQIAAKTGADPTRAGTGEPAPGMSKLTALRLEAEQLRSSLEKRKAEDERMKRLLVSYSGRLEMAPRLESELTELMRDYDTIQEQYRTLLKKSEESKIAVNLERRQIGEQFKIIDGARLPQRPFAPDRLRLNLMGFAGGVGVGLLLIGLLEYRDTSLKTDDDIVASLALPVLAVIPAMVTTLDRRRLRRRRWFVASATSLVVLLAVAAAVAWRFQLLRGWVS